MTSNLLSTVATAVALGIGLQGLALSQSDTTKLSFEKDIQPVLSKHCFQCHGTDRPAAGLDLRTATSAFKGSANGPVIINGSADTSLLVLRVANGTMPPKGAGEPLTSDLIELIRR